MAKGWEEIALFCMLCSGGKRHPLQHPPATAPTHSAPLIARLLDAGLDPNAINDEIGPEYARSPAIAAAAAGRIDSLEMLVEASPSWALMLT